MNHNQLKLSTNMLVALIAVFLAIVYLLLRIGFEPNSGNTMISLLNVLGISLFIIFFDNIVKRFFNVRNIAIKSTWITSYAFLTLLGLVIIIIAGFSVPFLGINLSIIFVLAGYIFFVVSILEKVNIVNIKKLLIPGIIVSPLFFWLAGMLYSDPLNPLFFENLFIAEVNKDTVFHGLVSAMFQTYNMSTIGVDGLEFLPYHIGSHWVLAQLSNLLNVPPITTLQMVVPIVYVPLYLKSFLYLTFNLNNIFFPNSLKKEGKQKSFFLAIFVISQIGFFPYSILEFGTPGSQHIATHTAIFSMILSFLCLTLCLNAQKLMRYKGFADIFLLFLIIPILIGSISITKISSGVMMLAIMAFIYVRFRLYHKHAFTLSIIISTFMFLAVYVIFINNPSHPPIYEASIAPFHFYNVLASIYHTPWFAYILFPIVHYSIPIIFIFLRIRTSNVTCLSNFWLKVKNKSLVDVEIILFLVILGSLPSLFFSLGGQVPQFWFLDFEYWMSTAFLLAFILSFLFKEKVKEYSIFGFRKNSSGKVYLFRSLAILVLLATLYNTGRAVIRGVGFGIRNRSLMIIETDHSINPIDSLITSVKTFDLGMAFNTISMLYTSHPNDELKKQKSYNLLHSFIELSKLPINEKKQSLIFIPQKDTLYWNLMAKHNVPHRISPFIVGGLSGIGMIDGMPPVDSFDGSLTGFSSYNFRIRHQIEEDCKINYLCEKIVKKGFSKLILVDSNSGEVNMINCEAEIITKEKITFNDYITETIFR